MGLPFALALKWHWIGPTANPCRRGVQLLRAVPCALIIAIAGGLPAAAEAPRLGLPLACEPLKTCFVQHYVDAAPDGGTQDFRCGHATYKGHTGVDFRILSAAAARQGVSVIAAAPGVVKSKRDGMADGFPRETGRDAIRRRECGNGVVLDHGDGWETQYCHLRQGSVRVGVGQKVERGTPLGEVGYSGLADSAHLHLSVRHQGRTIDPFTGRHPDGTCSREEAPGSALFDDAVIRAFPYADGNFLQIGFVGRVVGWAELERDHTAGQEITPQSDALIFFARLTHTRGGDRVQLEVTGPDGFAISSPGTVIERDKAIFVAHAGSKRTSPRWPAGIYKGEAALVRDGVAVRSARAAFVMP
jgi:hypothetical protein